MPFAARMGDRHRCKLHRGGEIVTGCASVLIGGQPAARKDDRAFCDGDEDDVVLSGEPTVLIGGRPAARLGDATAGGRVARGCATVLVGASPLAAALRDAARTGAPFVERPGGPAGERRK